METLCSSVYPSVLSSVGCERSDFHGLNLDLGCSSRRAQGNHKHQDLRKLENFKEFSPLYGYQLKKSNSRKKSPESSSHSSVVFRLFSGRNVVLSTCSRSRRFHLQRAFHEYVPWHLLPDDGPTRDFVFTSLGAAIGVMASVVIALIFQRQEKKALAATEERGPAMIPELSPGGGQKESVEWVNMVIHKIWKVYRRSIEAWLVGLLQPAIDGLPMPTYVTRVEIAEFSLHYEPLSVRTVQRRASRRANDLQYHIGLRYTGDARCLLLIHLKVGGVDMAVPVGVHDLDVDAELWVKLRLTPKKPYVATLSLAFVRLPTIKLVLAPFRIVNLFAIPFLSSFLSKLLTVDLPRLLVLPRHITFDFLPAGEDPLQQQHSPHHEQAATLASSLATRSANMVLDLLKSETFTGLAGHPLTMAPMSMSLEPSDAFVGELSVTLCEARNLPAFGLAVWSNPFCTLTVGSTAVESKRNSETSHPSGPRDPMWNQDFNFWVEDPMSQKLRVTLQDTSFGINRIFGFVQIPIWQLQDCVPISMWLPLLQDGPFGVKEVQGEIRVLLTYKSYVDRDADLSSAGVLPSSSTSIAYIKVFSHSEEDKALDSEMESDGEGEEEITSFHENEEIHSESDSEMDARMVSAGAGKAKRGDQRLHDGDTSGGSSGLKEEAELNRGVEGAEMEEDKIKAVGQVVGAASTKVRESLHLKSVWNGTKEASVHLAGQAGNVLLAAGGLVGAGALGIYSRAKGIVQGVQMGLREASQKAKPASQDSPGAKARRGKPPSRSSSGPNLSHEYPAGGVGGVEGGLNAKDMLDRLEGSFDTSMTGDDLERLRAEQMAARLVEWDLENSPDRLQFYTGKFIPSEIPIPEEKPPGPAEQRRRSGQSASANISSIDQQINSIERQKRTISDDVRKDEGTDRSQDRWQAMNGAINDLMDFFNR